MRLSQKLKEVSGKRVFGAISMVIITLTIIAFWIVLVFVADTMLNPEVTPSATVGDTETTESKCNVVGINLHGFLTTDRKSTRLNSSH